MKAENVKRSPPLKIRIGDYLLTSFIVLAAVGSLFSSRRQVGETAVVHYDGQKQRLQLDTAHRLVLEHAVIEVEAGRIHIVESDCPRQICQHTGWISHPGQTVVCAPNQILIEIAGHTQDYHAVSY